MYANTFTPCKIVGSVYTVEPPLTATFPQWPPFLSWQTVYSLTLV